MNEGMNERSRNKHAHKKCVGERVRDIKKNESKKSENEKL